MAINFAAASTAGLNNPGTEIITLVKDGSGNFINPPSYDKMRAYLSSGEVPMLFVTDETGKNGSLYQFTDYSETENKIRFSNDMNTIEFSAGAVTPVVSGAGGGGGGGWFVVTVSAGENGNIIADHYRGDIAAALERGEMPIVKYTNGGETQIFNLHKISDTVALFHYVSLAGNPQNADVYFLQCIIENEQVSVSSRTITADNTP